MSVRELAALIAAVLAIGPGPWTDTLLAQSPQIIISTAHESKGELATQAQIKELFKRFDLEPWAFTDRVVVNERAVPHSHPVLTLHTRHLRDDELLLSTYVHEQLHWYLAARPENVQGAIAELRELYPEIPVGGREGSSDTMGNYIHLIVCTLEDAANRRLMGELRAKEVLSFWKSDHYTAIYALVDRDGRNITAVLRRHGLTDPSAVPSSE